MAKRRRKPKKLAAKYKVRRTMLALLLLGLIGGAVVWFWGKVRTPDAGEVQQESFIALSDTLPAPEIERSIATVDNTHWNLVLISHMHPLPPDYEPPELAIITEGHKVDARIADELLRMFTHAKENGINLILHSAYRSMEYQQNLFSEGVRAEMARGKTREEAMAITATEIAMPGTSEHHTGLAVDIVTTGHHTLSESFDRTPAFQWLDENAHKHGFILRYPKDKQEITRITYEPWHYRYVGVEHATAMKESGFCLEEYLYVSMREHSRGLSDEDDDLENGEQD